MTLRLESTALRLLRRVEFAHVRFVGGILCVLAAVVVLALQVPHRFEWAKHTYDANAWRSPARRLLHTGETYLIPTDFQEAALTYVPRGSTFAVLPPPSPEIAAKGYGIPYLTLIDLPFWLQFLLLPSRMVTPSKAEYVLCFACDTDPWSPLTTWIWKNDSGELIGKVRRR